jgi:hypothetical protein
MPAGRQLRTHPSTRLPCDLKASGGRPSGGSNPSASATSDQQERRTGCGRLVWCFSSEQLATPGESRPRRRRWVTCTCAPTGWTTRWPPTSRRCPPTRRSTPGSARPTPSRRWAASTQFEAASWLPKRRSPRRWTSTTTSPTAIRSRSRSPIEASIAWFIGPMRLERTGGPPSP